MPWSRWWRRRSPRSARHRRPTTPVGLADEPPNRSEVAAQLTRREREIARLVAEGLTSRQVADACFLSVRTVDNHLSRIYDKLGIRSRTELAGALAPTVLENVS